jgi:hypothetical protein
MRSEHYILLNYWHEGPVPVLVVDDLNEQELTLLTDTLNAEYLKIESHAYVFSHRSASDELWQSEAFCPLLIQIRKGWTDLQPYLTGQSKVSATTPQWIPRSVNANRTAMAVAEEIRAVSTDGLTPLAAKGEYNERAGATQLHPGSVQRTPNAIRGRAAERAQKTARESSGPTQQDFSDACNAACGCAQRVFALRCQWEDISQKRSFYLEGNGRPWLDEALLKVAAALLSVVYNVKRSSVLFPVVSQQIRAVRKKRPRPRAGVSAPSYHDQAIKLADNAVWYFSTNFLLGREVLDVLCDGPEVPHNIPSVKLRDLLNGRRDQVAGRICECFSNSEWWQLNHAILDARLPIIDADDLIASITKEAALAALPFTTVPANRSTATANDARDKWLYEQAMKLVAWGTIQRRLNAKPKSWERIESDNGIKRAAFAYAKRHELPEPPPRKSGRPKG